MFEIDEYGIVRHKRTGATYAERLIDGVALDTTLLWESATFAYYYDPEQKEEIVGERMVSDEIQEVSKVWGTKRGEGKFYRKRRVPKLKRQSHPVKPKPCEPRHTRLSKHAEELQHHGFAT